MQEQDQELQVRSYAQMLQDGLDEVFSSEAYRRFLLFISNNPNYSYRNILLILQQCPHATKVMGFKAWLRQGRCVQAGQKGLRINALFEKGDQDDVLPIQKLKRAGKQKKDGNFRRISVFDISQTALLDGEGQAAPTAVPNGSFTLSEAAFNNPMQLFETEMLEGKVAHYGEILEVLEEITPLRISFQARLRPEGSCGDSYIAVRDGMSQLHTVRTIINQIVHVWRHPYCPDKEQLEIEAESVAFIVCRYLGLDTSDFSFNHIAKYSFGKERKALERFLDGIQKTALYFIDSIDGVLEARRIGYATGDTSDYFLFTNGKTALRMFRDGSPVYLVYAGRGELLTMSKKAIEEHAGPFAADRSIWFNACRRAAA